MEFLKSILTPELFEQFEKAVNEHNGNEANKDAQIKLANLASGEYVGKGKYDALQTILDGKTTELETANNLIAGFKKDAKGNEDLQAKITDYEGQVAQLQAQLKQTQLESAVKVALIEAKANDIDYMTYRLKEKGELTLDENGKVKGIDDLIKGLKTQFPTHFESSKNNGKDIEPLRLPQSESDRGADPKNLAEALKQKYENI